MHATRVLLVSALLLMASCTQFPQLEAVEGSNVRDAAYPRLISLDPLTRPPELEVSLDLGDDLVRRAAALRARGARLARSPVVDRATRRRMARGITTVQ